MSELKISLEQSKELDNTYLAHFVGAFDGNIPEDSLTELNGLLNSEDIGMRFIFDFSKLSFLNSYGIGRLVEWQQKIGQKDGQIIMVGLNDNVKEILTLVGVSNLFKVFEDAEEAIKSLNE